MRLFAAQSGRFQRAFLVGAGLALSAALIAFVGGWPRAHEHDGCGGPVRREV